MDILNILIICYSLDFDTQDSMTCLSNYLQCVCLTRQLVSFFKWILSFLSQLLPATRRRSLFIKRSAPYILLGSSKYIGLVSDLIVSFSYKLSLNSLFLHDCVLAIHYNQLLLILKYCVSSFNLFLFDLQSSTLSTKLDLSRFGLNENIFKLLCDEDVIFKF